MAGWGTEEPQTPEEEVLEERDAHEPSELDAMGLDKRRAVMGKTYGPTKTRVVGTFAAFFAIVAVVAVGFYFVAKELDKAPETNADAAPWSAPDAPQRPPKQLQ